MAAAVFLYEVGLWYMVAMAVFFWRQGARRAGRHGGEAAAPHQLVGVGGVADKRGEPGI